MDGFVKTGLREGGGALDGGNGECLLQVSLYCFGHKSVPECLISGDAICECRF